MNNIKENIDINNIYLQNMFKNLINKMTDIFTNDKVLIVKRKLTFTDLFYFICKYNIDSNSTYDTIYNNIILNNDIGEISKNAFVKKRSDIDSSYFNNVNCELLKFIYNNIPINKNRLIAVDGSQLNFLYSISTKSKFKCDKNKNYTIDYLSSLHDIELIYLLIIHYFQQKMKEVI